MNNVSKQVIQFKKKKKRKSQGQAILPLYSLLKSCINIELLLNYRPK